MLSLFTNPLEALEPADVAAIIGWPESLQVEFKRDLAGRDGRLDAWHSGGSVEQIAKVKLLKEIVALANTSGGHLILGIVEGQSLPSLAVEINSLPRCVDLAERLEQIAQSIDPPIPMLQVRGIPMQGSSGVVLFRIPESRSGPHRSIDKEIYVRRGTASVPVGMREIRDLVLSSKTRSEQIEKSFHSAAERFRTWFDEAPNPRDPRRDTNYQIYSGWNIISLPLSAEFDLGRLFRQNANTIEPQYQVHVKGAGHDHTLGIKVDNWPTNERPILRGVSFSDVQAHWSFLDISQNGHLNFGHRYPAFDSQHYVGFGELSASLFRMIELSHALSLRAGLPECECGLAVSLHGHPHNQTVDIRAFVESVSIGGFKEILTLPRLSYNSVDRQDSVAEIIINDICDSSGLRLAAPYKIEKV
jgi:hypothetical protein